MQWSKSQVSRLRKLRKVSKIDTIDSTPQTMLDSLLNSNFFSPSLIMERNRQGVHTIHGLKFCGRNRKFLYRAEMKLDHRKTL